MTYRPKQPAAFAVDRGGADRSTTSRRAHPHAVPRQGQGRRVPARDAWRRRCSTRARRARRSRTRSTTSIARCAGASAGSSVRSRRSTRSASRRRRGLRRDPPCSIVARSAQAPTEAAARSRGRPCRPGPGPADPAPAKRADNRSSRRTPAPSLVDLGDGVLCVEFHSKMNAIGGDTIQMLQAGVKEAPPRTSRRSSSATTRRTSRPAPT